MANEWKLTEPTDDELVPDLPSEHRQRKTNTAAVLQKEHATLGDGNSGGEHKPGSAVAWYLATGSIPALDVEGNALASTDNGRLWLDSTTKIFYALDDYNDPTVGNGWVAMGHLLGDIAINTDKFTVARATGNALVAGTLDVAGNFDPTTFETTNGGFLDEDDLASNSANKVASQQSLKAYIDGSVPSFSTRTTGTVSNNTATVASTDRFVKIYVDLLATNNTAALYKCDSGGGNALLLDIVESEFASNQKLSVSGLIKAGEYWKVIAANVASGAINYVIMTLE